MKNTHPQKDSPDTHQLLASLLQNTSEEKKRAAAVQALAPSAISQASIGEEGPDIKKPSDMSEAPKPSKTFSLSSLPKAPERFGSIEHKAIGDQAFQDFCDLLKANNQGSVLKQIIKGFKITLSDQIHLSPGDIVALAGDFYGLPDKPICEGPDGVVNNNNTSTNASVSDSKHARFKQAYQSLAYANRKEVNAILDQIDKEKEALFKAVEQEVKPKFTLDQEGKKANLKYELITKQSFFMIPFICGSRYADLLKTNFDHFEADALVAYQAGHAVALETAYDAGLNDDEEEAIKGLTQAFAQELFACHFLTDLFASGHMRAPRRAIYEAVSQKMLRPIGRHAVAGLLAKAMHDEDGDKGLWVQSKQNPKGWQAFGDNCYFNHENKINVTEVCAAVKVSLLEIYNAYYVGLYQEKSFTKVLEESTAYQNYLPSVQQQGNHPPLFKVENKEVKLRKKIGRDENNQPIYDYTASWDPVWTVIKLNVKHQKAQLEKMAPPEKTALIEQLKIFAKTNKDQLVAEQEQELAQNEQAHSNQTPRCTLV